MLPRVLLFTSLAVCGLQASAASVSGRAVLRNGSSPSGPCHAALRAQLDRRGAPEPDVATVPDGKTSFSVPLNQNGYFQTVGVPPGKYMLVVECPTTSAVRELQVQANQEIRIAPLLLEDFAFEVTLTPKLDPEGQPWLLTVDATTPRLRRIADKAATSAEGRWIRRGLVAGNYRVSISSSDGKAWLQQFFNLRRENGLLSLRLPFIRVQGEVRLSSQPVPARLRFHNDAGGEPMKLTSDNGGFFEGWLPVTPGVQDTKWTVEAHGTRLPISRRLSGIKVHSAGGETAWIDLDLPVFAVHGTVVTDKGQLQTGVPVTFEDVSNGARTSTATDDSGGFELQELPPGKYSVQAESLDGISEPTPLQVVKGLESDLKLVLKSSESVSFHVVSSQGPVAGASVQVWIPPGVPRFFTHTDPEGRFEVKLPPGNTELGLTVGAPGYAIKLMRVPVSSDKSSDANTIALDESGGTLIFDLQPHGHPPDSSSTPYLVHNGAIEALGTLANWGSDQAYASSDGRMVLWAIEPGDYALCFIKDPAELTILWLGTLPMGSCRSGSVEHGETVTLSPQ